MLALGYYKFKISWVKVCMVAVHDPTEGEVDAREGFWNDLDRVVE